MKESIYYHTPLDESLNEDLVENPIFKLADKNTAAEIVLFDYGNHSNILKLADNLVTQYPDCQRFHLAYKNSAGERSSPNRESSAYQLAQHLKVKPLKKHFVVIGYTTPVFLNLHLKNRYRHSDLVMCGQTDHDMHLPKSGERCYFDGTDQESLSEDFQQRYFWCEQAIRILSYHLAQWEAKTVKAMVLQTVIKLCQTFVHQHQFDRVYGLLTCCLHPILAGKMFEPTTDQNSYNHYHHVMATRRYLPGMAPTLIEISDHLAAGQPHFKEMNIRQCLQELIDKLTQRQQKWGRDTGKYQALTDLIRKLQSSLDQKQLQVKSVRGIVEDGLQKTHLKDHQHPYLDLLLFSGKKTATEKTLERSLTQLQQCQDPSELKPGL